MSDSASPRFKKGDYVRRKSAPDQCGLVRDVELSPQAGVFWYLINFGGVRTSVAEGDLELVPDSEDAWDALRGGRVAGASAFHLTLTLERLIRPPSRIAESFGSARAVLYPFQFKPLLKFLDNPRSRLLIADDVGVGKTLEAGYILRELRARGLASRVLIIVPSRLRPKWHAELARRFSEHFEIVDTRTLRTRLAESPEPFACIASYESARKPTVRQQIRDSTPQIDLLILDEAHRVRNPDTQQHRVISELAELADAVVFLTATPIQTSDENLYRLLRLLEPESFPNLDAFQRLASNNRPLVDILRALGRIPPDGAAVLDAIKRLRAARSSISEQDALLDSIAGRAERLPDLDRAALIDLQRDVSEFSAFETLMTRTRKADVIPNRPVRKPQAYTVSFSPEEMKVYEAAGRLVRLVRPQNSPLIEAFVATQYFRCVASCIPAALEYFQEAANRSVEGELATTLAEEDELGEAAEAIDSAETHQARKGDIQHRLRELLDEMTLPAGTDSKFDAFQRAITEVWREDEAKSRQRRKIVVFSYFLRTLAYLSRRLGEQRVEHRTITGRVRIDEREVLIGEFLSQGGVDVLLSSEVGGEGIDLQKACVIVNYDLPWNPMVVEQRIGRLDRLGQRAPIITILNLVASNTVEQRILYRLYRRLEVFTSTLGDLEPILGNRVSELLLRDLRGDLASEELDRQIDEIELQAARAKRDAETVVAEGDQLLAADQAFLDEIEALLGSRKIPGAGELHRFLTAYLALQYRGFELPDRAIAEVVEAHLPGEMGDRMSQRMGLDADARRLGGRLRVGPIRVTFDAEAALDDPRAELITSRHPLIRLAVADQPFGERAVRAFALSVTAPELGTDGWWVFSIHQFAVSGERSRVDLVPLFSRLDTGDLAPPHRAASMLAAMIDRGRSMDRALPSSREGVEVAIDALRKEAQRTQSRLDERERTLDLARWARRRATKEAILSVQLQRAESLLETLKSREASPHALRSAEGRVRSAKARLAEHRESRLNEPRFGVSGTHVACGILRVEGQS